MDKYIFIYGVSYKPWMFSKTFFTENIIGTLYFTSTRYYYYIIQGVPF